MRLCVWYLTRILSLSSTSHDVGCSRSRSTSPAPREGTCEARSLFVGNISPSVQVHSIPSNLFVTLSGTVNVLCAQHGDAARSSAERALGSNSDRPIGKSQAVESFGRLNDSECLGAVLILLDPTSLMSRVLAEPCPQSLDDSFLHLLLDDTCSSHCS